MCLWCNTFVVTQRGAGEKNSTLTCTYMSIQGPVVYFELVDKDLHRASDLVDLKQQLCLFSFVGACR